MFRKTEAEAQKEQGHDPTPPKEVRVKDGHGEVTIVGPGARLEGTIVSAGSLRIDGQVRGGVTAEGDVMLSSHSQVEADISARNVIVAGRLKGNIVAKGKVELTKGARVEGDITSKALVVAEGAGFFGRSIMSQPAPEPTVVLPGRIQEARVVVPDRVQGAAPRR